MTDIQEAGGSNPPLRTMKAKLKFDLTDPDDREEHLRCVKSLDMAMALFDIKEFIRSNVKYTDKETINLEKLNDEFTDILDKRDINLDSLIS